MPAEAKEDYVLSPSDVRNIRSYVQLKYAAMPKEKKAEIVADAVTRIIQKQLPPLDEAAKKQITAELIRYAVLEQQRPVRADDILQACLKLDRSNDALMEPVRSWLEQQLHLKMDKQSFISALDRLESGMKRYAGEPGQQDESGSASLLMSLNGLHQADGAVIPSVDEQETGQTAEVIPHPSLSAAASPAAMPKTRFRPYGYGLLCVLLFAVTITYGWTLTRPSDNGLQPPVTLRPVQPAGPLDGLPAELRYADINTERLADYLAGRSSVLAEETYMNAIIDTAKEFDIHPLLLFAITGQEQGFVPTTNKYAKQIANNPFNVFHSWKEYNTDIYDSAAIASRTIVRLSKGRPEGTDPITWINREYAEDPNWSNGVRKILEALRREVETP